MSDIVRAKVVVRGIVQGVGFRAFTRQRALGRGLTGGVRNLEGGRVEACIQGPRSDVEAMIADLHLGPSHARVDHLTVTWESPSDPGTAFSIWD